MKQLIGTLLVTVALFSQATLFADVTGSILGTVTDSSGAVIAGATVVVTNESTNLTAQAITDGQGQYRILAIPIGSYRVEASVAGFRKEIQTGVVLTVNEQREISFQLKVGDTSEQVSVVGDVVAVETTSTQLGEVIGEKSIKELPLDGRSFLDLMGLQTGVAPVSARNEAAGTISVNGQRENSNGFLVNGTDVSEVGNFGAGISPNLDAIQEFRFLTNSFDPEYGRFSGGIMNTVTKSGTNSIHGTAFEFLRNDDLDARSFFQSGLGAYKQNQFGYAVGGPAIKNRLFWFTDLQGTKFVNGGSTGETTVLTDAQRQGDFGAGALTGTVSGPYWAQVLSQRLGYTVNAGEPYSQVFPNGVIPQSAWDPVAKNMLQYIPAANSAGSEYVAPPISTYNNDYKSGQRVDLVTKSTGNWSAYYNLDQSSNLSPYGGSSFAEGFGSDSTNMSQLATLTNTFVVSPTAVNEARLSYTRMAYRSSPQGGSFPSLSSLGFASGPLGINNAGPTGYSSVPNINLNNFSFGDPGQYVAIQNTYQIGDSFSKVIGRHTIKFGGEYRYYQMNNRSGAGYLGQFTFDGAETGLDIADFLLGAPNNFTQVSPQVLDGRARYGGAFAQDSFRVSSTFTVNFGLRWEFDTPWWDEYNRLGAIIPGEKSTQYPGAPTGMVYPGDPGVPKTLGPTRYGNFAPRLGFAWAPAVSGGLLRKLIGGPGKTSIRSGLGIFYNAIQDNTSYWNIGDIPFGEYWQDLAPTELYQPYLTRSTGQAQSNPFPFVIPAPGSQAAKNFNFTPDLPLAAVTAYKTDNKMPYGLDYNFTIQRELPASLLLSVGYVGTLGRHLLTMVEANPGNPQECLSLMGSGVMAGTLQCGKYLENSTFELPNGTLVNGTRSPLGNDFTTTFYEANIANSDYNSLPISLERRIGSASFLFAYTWSKSLDDGSFFNDRMNYSNHALGRGLSAFDSTHNFVGSYTYQIPFERAFHALPSRLVKGWEFSGITRFATGLPVGVSGSYENCLCGTSGLDRPDFSGPLVYAGNPRTDGHLWMTSSGFSIEPLGTFGDVPKRFFHGPGLNNWNIGIHKNTQLRENVMLQIRGEFFNAFNHAQFSAPNGLLSGGQFGVITSTQVAGRIGQIAAKIVF